MKRLDEKLLASDFTFGFELEGYIGQGLLASKRVSAEDREALKDALANEITDDDEYKDACDAVDEIETLSDYYSFAGTYGLSTDMDSYVVNEDDVYELAELNMEEDKYFPKDAKWIKKLSSGYTSDASLSDSNSFEWRSPVMVFTPEAIAHTIAFLKHFKTIGYVNDDCGFHTHIAFNGITEEDAIWITLKLSQDYEMIEKIQKLSSLFDRGKDETSTKEYPDISFVSRWAETKYLNDISDALKNNDIASLCSLLNDTKYRALRIHPQGTLEWRSPRYFLDMDDSGEYIKSFFLLLYDFVSWMRNVLDSEVIGNYDKYNLMELIKSYAGSNRIFYKPQEKKEDKYRSALLRSIKNPNVLIQFGETVSMRLLYVAFTRINSDDRELIKKSIMSLVHSGKKFPNNILALIFIAFETKELNNFVKYLKQPIPVKEIVRCPTGGIYNIIRCFENLSKEEVLQVINDKIVGYNNLVDGFRAEYLLNNKFYMPVWLNNAIIEKYGKPITKDMLSN